MATNQPLPPAETNDTIDLAEIGALFRRRAPIIASFIAAAIVFSFFHVMLAVPQFTAHGSLYLGDAQSTATGANDTGNSLGFLSDFTSVNDVETQIELLSANTLIQQAILETGINAQISPGAARTIKYWRWKFGYGGRIEAFQPNSSSLQALYASTPGHYKVVLGENNTYRLLTAESWFNKPNVVLTGTIGQPASGHGLALLIKPATPDFAAVPGRIYDLQIVSPSRLAEALLGGALSVTAGGTPTQPTKVAFLLFRWNDPFQAQAFTNQVMQDFIATQLSWKTQSASTTENFVSQQLRNISASLATADQNLAAYQSQTGIINVPGNAQSVINALSQYQTQRASLQLQQEALQQLAQELNNSTSDIDPYLVSQTTDTVLAQLTSSLSDAEVKLTGEQMQFTGDTREILTQQAQIAKIKYAIKTIINNDLLAANKNLSSLDKMIADYQARIKTMPAESLKVISLQRASDVFGQLYVLLMEKEEEAEVSKAATIINTRIVTLANTPQSNTSPKAGITLVFGAFAGLVLGIGLVFLQRATSGRFESAQEIRNTVHLPVYGTIPPRPKTVSEYDAFGANLRQPFFEAFRLLRSRIYKALPPDGAKLILVVSASKDNPTALTAINLAKTLAENGKTVLLADADFNLSPINDSFNLDSGQGFIDWLRTGNKPGYKNPPHEKFKILPAGTSSLANAALLDGPALPDIFSQMKTEFDFIVLNCPPLPEVSDSLALGNFADLVLSVVNVSGTPRRLFTEHAELLSFLEKPHGIIINAVEK